MTAVEKAEELVRKYYTFGLNDFAQSFSWYECKQCALIAVDEILNENSKRGGENDEIIEYEPYWLEVKHEIKKFKSE